jgi:hypothetical protein
MTHFNRSGANNRINNRYCRKQLRRIYPQKMRQRYPQKGWSQNKRIGKMYSTRLDDKTDIIYSKQFDQDDNPNRPSRCNKCIPMIRQDRQS